MLCGRLSALLGLLSGAWILPGLGRPGFLAPPANQTHVPGRGALVPQVPALALGSWKAFLGLQKTRQLGTDRLQPEQEVATAVSLPLDPREVAREACKAVSFVQVLSQPGCTSARVRNHLCFGRCSSLYIPGSDPAPHVLCNSCMPTRQRRIPVVLWCRSASASSPRRVKASTVLVGGCQCRPRP